MNEAGDEGRNERIVDTVASSGEGDRSAPATASVEALPKLFRKGAEVGAVAILGPLAGPLLLMALGWSPTDLLRDARLLFTALMLDATITLLLVWGFLRLEGERPALIGWRRADWGREAAWGVAALPILFGSTMLLGNLFRHFVPEWVTESNPLLELVRTPSDLALLIIASVYVGGFKEEIQRAFILERFRAGLGGVWLGLAAWSIFFGYGHAVQGIDHAIAAGWLGLLFGLLYLWRGSLTAVILSHALFDILTLLFHWWWGID